MSEKFKKGQLVAVRDDANGRWSIWIYDHASPEGLHLCRPPNLCGPHWWRECRPAEDVWPGVFLGWERRAGEQAADAVAMESELVQRLRRQIGWLCERLEDFGKCTGAQRCPLISYHACAYCWEQASLKAVENADGA